MIRPVYHKGPRSDHFDGEKFFLPRPFVEKRDIFLVMEWSRSRKPSPWPSAVDIGAPDRPPEKVGGGDVRVVLINHASLLVQAGGVNILVDPVYARRAGPFGILGPRRIHAPGVEMAELPRIDLILISHNHYDHFDIKALQALVARDRPRILAPLGNDVLLPELGIETRDWGGTLEGADFRVHVVPSRHWSKRTLFDGNRALWGSFVVETPAGKLFLSGDTGYGEGEELKAIGLEHGPFRLASLPIGAYEPRWFMGPVHMDPEEAVQAMRDLRAERAVGMHWGCFQLTDEPRGEPLELLARAREKLGLVETDFTALLPGRALDR
jgi:L-ascorbate metabolism protein UlaG (beta-lactamase superfamily)